MSETHGSNFLKFLEQRRRTFLIGGGAIAAAAITAEVAREFIVRSRRNKQLALDAFPKHEQPLDERQKLFAFEKDENDQPTFVTRLAAYIFLESRETTIEQAASEKAIHALFSNEDEGLKAKVSDGLYILIENGFIGTTTLQSDPNETAYFALEDLNRTEAENNAALSQAIYELGSEGTGYF